MVGRAVLSNTLSQLVFAPDGRELVMGLPEDQIRQIVRGNAIRLFDLPFTP